MKKRQTIFIAVAIFMAGFLLIMGSASFLPDLLGFHPRLETEGFLVNALIIFAVLFLVPVLFLKGLMLFSRKVTHDDSHFDVSRIPDPQEKPRPIRKAG